MHFYQSTHDMLPKHPVPDRVKLSFVIFDIRALWHLGLSVRVAGCQKNTNDGLIQSGTGCFIAVLMQNYKSVPSLWSTV